MKRSKENKIQLLERKVQTLSVLTDRYRLARQLGLQYEGDRDLYQALGYPTILTASDFYPKYTRMDIAKAVIDRPAKATWRGELNLIENAEKNETGLEVTFNEISERLRLRSFFNRVDRVSGLGKYGLIVLGLDDVKESKDFEKEVSGGVRKLLYVKVVSEKNGTIKDWEKNPNDPRYGQPKIYNISFNEPGSSLSQILAVHHTRVIHVVDDILESEVEGFPRLEVVWNRLMDLEKLIGGSAEMFWRGARPGYKAKVDDGYMLTPTEENKLQDQLNEYEHNLRRFLTLKGISVDGLQQQLADPKNYVDVQIQMISAVTGIPKRILSGSERGELSSSQDQDEWDSYVTTRRTDFCEPRIIKPFVDRCIELKILPKPITGKYDVKWTDAFSRSEKDMAEVGKTRALALQAYASVPGIMEIMPFEAFLEFCLGLTTEQIELITEMTANRVLNESNSLTQEVNLGEEQIETE